MCYNTFNSRENVVGIRLYMQMVQNEDNYRHDTFSNTESLVIECSQVRTSLGFG